MTGPTRELSDATIEWARDVAHNFAVIWVEAYLEARKVAMSKGLPETPVLNCAQQVADEVFNRYMQRLEDGEIS